MNEIQKLNIIRNMLNTLLGAKDVKHEEDTNKLKNKYIQKSKKVIDFYRHHMNENEKKKLEQFNELFNSILSNSFNCSDMESIDTYIYLNVYPILKKTFDYFIVYINNLVNHKTDPNYQRIIKNFNPVIWFSQHIIRMADEDFCSEDEEIESNSEFDLNEIGSFLNTSLDSTINEELTVALEGITEEQPDLGNDIQSEIFTYYSRTFTVDAEAKLKEQQQKKDILKCIYHKKNVLSQQEITLYNQYYEEQVKMQKISKSKRKESTKGKHTGTLSITKPTDNSNNDRGFFSLSLDMNPEMYQLQPEKEEKGDKEKKMINNKDEFNDIIKQLERQESTYFERKINRLIHKWIKEEEGRRLIINLKAKVEGLYYDFRKKNNTITDKDVIPFLFYIDKKLFLNYALIHQYNHNRFYYIAHLLSSFSCSDTNDITFDELWFFLISNLPLNNFLYKENLLVGFEKHERRKKIDKNFTFSVTFVKNFLLFLLMDLFVFISNCIRSKLFLKKNYRSLLKRLEIKQNKIESTNFYSQVDSFSIFYSSGSESESESESEPEAEAENKNEIESEDNKSLKVGTQPLKNSNWITSIEEGEWNYLVYGKQIDESSEENEENEENELESSMMEPRKKATTIESLEYADLNFLLFVLLMLWGQNVQCDLNIEEYITSDEIPTDYDLEEMNEPHDHHNKNSTYTKRFQTMKTLKKGKTKKFTQEEKRFDEQLNERKYNSSTDIEEENQRERKNKKRSKSTKVRSLRKKIRKPEEDKNKNKDEIEETVKQMIIEKKKINLRKLGKKEKLEKHIHELVEFQKLYDQKEYGKNINTLLNSVVKIIKPSKKNYYNKIIKVLERGERGKPFSILFRKKEDLGKIIDQQIENIEECDKGNHVKSNGLIYNGIIHLNCDDKKNEEETEEASRKKKLKTLCAVQHIKAIKDMLMNTHPFVNVYLKKEKRKLQKAIQKKKEKDLEEEKYLEEKSENNNTSIKNEKQYDIIHCILLLCNFKLYKKKFINKFKSQHIYILIFFINHILNMIDSFLNEMLY